MDDQLKEAAAAAWQEVLKHPRADLKNYLESQGVVFSGGRKPAANECPFCKGRKKFGLLPADDGGWIYKCVMPQCDGHAAGGIEKFIQIEQGCDWREARRILHRLTGIPGFDEMLEEKKREQTQDCKTQDSREEEEEPERSGGEVEETEDLGFIRIPDIGRNAYESFWEKLILSAGHRKDLKAKRGLNDAWITSLGFKTATRANKPLLEPLLEMFPEKELLRAGLAKRDIYTQQIEVADALWGKRWDKDRKEHVYEDLIIIPYLDEDGRIIGLRPHKLGLSTQDFRKEEVSDFYNKRSENLRIIYGEPFLKDRSKDFEHTAVICEGEFKSVVLPMCGIPAIGFQGIEFFRQNKESKQAIRQTVDLLKRHGIREVIVVFDNEAKLDKPFSERFNAEIWARFTALVLEDHGFKALFGVLPDEWRDENGKADWDGRMAYHVRNSKSHEAAVKAASAEFHKFLRSRTGEKPRIRRAPRQMEWNADLKEDVIMQALNKLRHVPKIFVGGSYEIDLAGELTNWCHPDYVDKLGISKLTDALRECYGGYYMPKTPSESLEKRALETVKEIDQIFKEHEETVHLTREQVRQYTAARDAAYIILYRYPKAFTDFTAESRYKVLCHEPDGGTRLDRLIVFKDKNGRKSKPIQMAGDKLNSSQELRKFFPKVGSYHWWGNQDACDFWLQELDVQNYQRTITEIDTYGWNREVGIYLMGDCAVGADGEFIFPDRNGIIWYKDLGYKNSEGVENGVGFCHRPPMLFPEAQDARKAYQEMDWTFEHQEVDAIWVTMQKDFTDAFGSIAGLAAIGGFLQYLAHPETHRHLSGKPGLWMQGRKGSGKTKTGEAGMRIFGFPRIYEIVALGSTKVGIERNLSQFSGLPVHIDEWRNLRADENTVGFITNAYNEIGISKGTTVGTKSTRKSKAATIPFVTGEDGATDPALRSRYLRLIMSASQRKGTREEQRARYFRMLENADMYHRVGRFIFRHRDKFATRVVDLAKEFMADPETVKRISGDREQEVMGICYAAVIAAHEILDSTGSAFPMQEEFREFMLKHGAESCDEITGDVFMVNYFADCANMINRAVPNVEKYLRICRGTVNHETGRISIIPDITSEDGRVLVLVAYRELYDTYLEDISRQRKIAPIARANIQGELKAEDAWIKLKVRPGVHQLRLPWHNGARDMQRNFWALDYHKCPPELKEVFRPLYERELNDKHHELTDDDQVVHETEAPGNSSGGLAF